MEGAEMGPYFGDFSGSLVGWAFSPGLFRFTIKGCNNVGYCSYYSPEIKLTITNN
jgi:hypothetical protein